MIAGVEIENGSCDPNHAESRLRRPQPSQRPQVRPKRPHDNGHYIGKHVNK